MIINEGHGGAVLIVPNEAGDWSEFLNPFAYRFSSPDTTLRDAIRKTLNDADAQAKILDQLSKVPIPPELRDRVTGAFPQSKWGAEEGSIRAISPLARVDGAIVITHDLKLLGFGAKIEFRLGLEIPVCKFSPVSGAQEVVHLRLEDVGGMRHQSAAQFVAASKASVAIVVSQDRHVSLMNWENQLNSVCVIRNAEWWV